MLARLVLYLYSVVCLSLGSPFFSLGDTIIALFKKSKKPRKIHIFCGWGRGKNHKGKPQFLLSRWVVFLDTDCKMNASDLSQLRQSLSNPHTHTPKTNYYINISTFPQPNPTSKFLTTFRLFHNAFPHTNTKSKNTQPNPSMLSFSISPSPTLTPHNLVFKTR